jgi:hypothetical protein
MCGAEANRATEGDLSQPQAHFKLQSKNFFDLAHGQSAGRQADPPLSRGGCLPLCCPAPLSACGNHSGEAEHLSGIGLKLFGFIAELVLPSSRNGVRHHPRIAFTLPRIPTFFNDLQKPRFTLSLCLLYWPSLDCWFRDLLIKPTIL